MINVRESSLQKIILSTQVDKIIIVLAASSIIPLLIHFLPSPTQIPAGAVWLPIFYAPFIAVIFFKPHVAVFVSVLVPLLNMFLTGRPVPPMTNILIIELLIFTSVSRILYNLYDRFLGV